MVQPNDWRLTSQENYLKNVELFYKIYSDRKTETDHDHCEFCLATFSDAIHDALKEGYTTANDYWWVCKECFEDFNEMFRWKVIDESK